MIILDFNRFNLTHNACFGFGLLLVVSTSIEIVLANLMKMPFQKGKYDGDSSRPPPNKRRHEASMLSPSRACLETWIKWSC